jgi:hypothetical protein
MAGLVTGASGRVISPGRSIRVAYSASAYISGRADCAVCTAVLRAVDCIFTGFAHTIITYRTLINALAVLACLIIGTFWRVIHPSSSTWIAYPATSNISGSADSSIGLISYAYSVLACLIIGTFWRVIHPSSSLGIADTAAACISWSANSCIGSLVSRRLAVGIIAGIYIALLSIPTHAGDCRNSRTIYKASRKEAKNGWGWWAGELAIATASAALVYALAILAGLAGIAHWRIVNIGISLRIAYAALALNLSWSADSRAAHAKAILAGLASRAQGRVIHPSITTWIAYLASLGLGLAWSARKAIILAG